MTGIISYLLSDVSDNDLDLDLDSFHAHDAFVSPADAISVHLQLLLLPRLYSCVTSSSMIAETDLFVHWNLP